MALESSSETTISDSSIVVGGTPRDFRSCTRARRTRPTEVGRHGTRRVLDPADAGDAAVRTSRWAAAGTDRALLPVSLIVFVSPAGSRRGVEPSEWP
jgi:hypothetical protein